MIHQLTVQLRYVPDFVFKSPYFWLLLIITIVVILYVHNRKLRVKETGDGKRSLRYINKGREGSVIYKDEVSAIKFYFEFGGGNCVAIISIPNKEDWENETKRKLVDRNAIINFVAKQALQDQVKGGTYKIEEQSINLYNG